MSVRERTAEVDVRDDDGVSLGSVSVSVARPSRSKATVVIAHGAGGNMDTPSIVSLQHDLAASSVSAVRFNFLYSEKGRRAPDRQPKLVATWRAVASFVRSELRPKKLFLAGRSMGGRMASYLAADGYACDGLVFLAYPLHPPGKPDRLRKDHLANVSVPLLFISGTRDSFAGLPLLEPLAKQLKARLFLLEGADHGFKVPKKLGRSVREVEQDVAATVLEFIENV